MKKPPKLKEKKERTDVIDVYLFRGLNKNSSHVVNITALLSQSTRSKKFNSSFGNETLGNFVSCIFEAVKLKIIKISCDELVHKKQTYILPLNHEFSS